jgi:hypothetical protein
VSHAENPIRDRRASLAAWRAIGSFPVRFVRVVSLGCAATVRAAAHRRRTGATVTLAAGFPLVTSQRDCGKIAFATPEEARRFKSDPAFVNRARIEFRVYACGTGSFRHYHLTSQDRAAARRYAKAARRERRAPTQSVNT